MPAQSCTQSTWCPGNRPGLSRNPVMPKEEGITTKAVRGQSRAWETGDKSLELNRVLFAFAVPLAYRPSSGGQSRAGSPKAAGPNRGARNGRY